MVSKRMAAVAVIALAGLALGRAGMLRFQEKERAWREQCRTELQKMGITRDAAKLKYPTPSIGLISAGCLLPGGTTDVVVKGKFAPGTKFIFQSDDIEVLKENLVGGEYRATVKAAAGTAYQTAGVVAMTPVTCLTARAERAVTIGGKYAWTLNAANGWRIVAKSPANKTCPPQSSGEESYELLFYRPGEANPFEKRAAKLYYSPYESTNYRFNISQEDPQLAGSLESMQSMMQKLSDPKLTDAQRDQLMKKIEQAQQQMQADMQKMPNPAYGQQLEAKRKQFGCESIQLTLAAGAAKGTMHCGRTVGSQIGINGSVQSLGR